MSERITREDFGEGLVGTFGGWASGTTGMPYKDENKIEGMKQFNLSSEEFDRLISLTVLSWIF